MRIFYLMRLDYAKIQLHKGVGRARYRHEGFNIQIQKKYNMIESLN